MAKLSSNKQAEIDVRSEEFMEKELRKPFGYGSSYWAKWGAISHILDKIEVNKEGDLLDVGCGAGWTAYFFALTGFNVTGLDIVPLNVKTAKRRFKENDLKGDFSVSDMETFKLSKKFDVINIFDALHHTEKQATVLNNAYRHLKPGGWLIIGEPTLLHALSPHARRTQRDEGVLERGITVRSLRRDFKNAGFTKTRRFFEGTNPYEGRLKGFVWQLIRLVACNFIFAPQSSMWFAAQKPKNR